METIILGIIGIFVVIAGYGAYRLMHVTKPPKPMHMVNSFLDMIESSQGRNNDVTDSNPRAMDMLTGECSFISQYEPPIPPIPPYLSLVTFDSSNAPGEYSANYPIRPDVMYIFLGEIPNMPGYCVVSQHPSGKIFSGLHTELFKECVDETKSSN